MSYEFEDFRFSEFGKELEQREEKELVKVFKICTRCGELKPLFKFARDKRNSDGKISVCKKCRIVEYLKYYYKNKDRILIREKEYRKNSKRDRSRYFKDYQKKHKEELKEKAQKWYQKNRGAIKARNLEYFREHEQACLDRRKLWRGKNKEEIKKYNREYKQKHK